MAQKSQMHLEDWLDDLCVRFIINLPQEDLSSVARICFQVEEAQWFYEDFIRPLDPTLPSMTLRTFCLRIFQHCPLLASFSIENHTKAFEEFLQYKTRVPVRGAIMLNQAMDSVVLVKGWKKGASWSFPRGKINKDEDDLDCAIREVYEETGLDLRAANLVPTGKKPKYIEITMREQQLRLYVFRNVPMDTHFQPRTRKEISKIQWYKLSELPTFRKKGAPTQQDTPSTSQINKFYMVAPFLVDLKKWIASLKKMEERRAASDFQVKHEQTPRNTISQHIWTQDAPMTEDNTRHSSYIVPAIDTLDGATKELQRLLRGQPPTQGIQPLPQLNVRSEDKGSALLSLLKANDGVLSQISQTPLDQIATKPPPPRNPHHRNNQQPVSWESYAQQSPGAFNQNHAASPFAHPQRHVSDSQIFIKASCPSQQLNILQKISQRHIDDQSPSQGPLKTGYSQQQLYQGQMPHRTVGALRPLPLQLNDHSMALLDAFKRDPTSGKTATHAGTSEHGQDVAAAPLKPGFGAQFPTLNTNIQDTTSKYSFPTEMSSEQRKPAPEMSADQLQSTLLQLFKQNSPQSVNRAQNWKRRETEPLESTATHGLHGQDSTRNAAIPPREEKLQSKTLQPNSTRSPRQEQATTKTCEPRNSTLTTAINEAKPRVPRILQRGESLEALLSKPSPRSCGEKNLGPAPPNTADTATNPATIEQSHRRTGSSLEQKQKLLSLFGKAQPSGPASLDLEEDTQSKTRLVSMPSAAMAQSWSTDPSALSSRGTESPISPADQTFLLEYLQNITNSASH